MAFDLPRLRSGLMLAPIFSPHIVLSTLLCLVTLVMAPNFRALSILCLFVMGVYPQLLSQAQEDVPLVHRWVIEPNLECFSFKREPKEIFIDLARLKSPVDSYRLSEARNIALSNNQIRDESKAEAIEVILQALRAENANRPVRQALVSALLKLTDGSEFNELWQLSMADEALRGFVETALIEWKNPSAQAVWLSRLTDTTTPEADLQLAIRGVAAINAQAAHEPLIALIRSDDLGLPTKMLATRSLGALTQTELEPLAKELLDSQRFAKEQLAAQLLVNHASDLAQQLMTKILNQSFAPAQVIAYRWCTEHRLELARELAAAMLQHTENEIRLLAVNVLHRFDDPTSLELQGQLLNDRNVTVRQTVRDHLIEKSQLEPLQATVNAILTEHLQADTFEGAEQAILVTVALKLAERSPRLVELLEHPRPEVGIRAAWALQQLVERPEDLAAIHLHCQHWTERIVADVLFQDVHETDVLRLAFAFQALGHNAYLPADEMLRVYVPKNSQRMRTNARNAAIWALGEIWRGRLDSGLEQPLAERMLDPAIVDAEAETVKYVCAIALGKIGNPSSITQLEASPEKMPAPIGHAVNWSIEQLKNASQTVEEKD